MARGLALAAAIAVSLLAVSGAGGAGAQTPKRGGTVVVASSAAEPACLNLLDLDAPRHVADHGAPYRRAESSRRRSTSAPDFTWRQQLVSGVEFTTKPPFTLTYHIRPEARWSDGVPVTAADFVFTHEAQRTYGSESGLHRTMVKSVRTLDRKTVRVVLRDRVAAWRELFGAILPRHALRNEDLMRSGATGSTTRRRASPSGADRS